MSMKRYLLYDISFCKQQYVVVGSLCLGFDIFMLSPSLSMYQSYGMSPLCGFVLDKAFLDLLDYSTERQHGAVF